MMYSEAKAILSQPLKFGDPEQIKARELLGKVQRLAALLDKDEENAIRKECNVCGGTGWLPGGMSEQEIDERLELAEEAMG